MALSQVWITYGPRPNYDLLLSFGFVETDNPFDEYILTRGLASDNPLVIRRWGQVDPDAVEAAGGWDVVQRAIMEEEARLAADEEAAAKAAASVLSIPARRATAMSYIQERQRLISEVRASLETRS